MSIYLEIGCDRRQTFEVLARQYRLGQESVEIESPVVSMHRQHVFPQLLLLPLFLRQVLFHP